MNHLEQTAFPSVTYDELDIPMNRPLQMFLSPPKPAVVVLAWVLMLLIGSLDYITGRDFAVSPYYLVPICWAAWAAGRRAGHLAGHRQHDHLVRFRFDVGLRLSARADALLERADVFDPVPVRGPFDLGVSDGPLSSGGNRAATNGGVAGGNSGTQKTRERPRSRRNGSPWSARWPRRSPTRSAIRSAPSR